MGHTCTLEKPGGVNSSHRLLVRERKLKEGVIVAVVQASRSGCDCDPSFFFPFFIPLRKGISRIFLSKLCCDGFIGPDSPVR